MEDPSPGAPPDDLELFEAVASSISSDLSTRIDREMATDPLSFECVSERAIGEGVVHISFKLEFETRAGTRHGCVLIPLPEAQTLAALMTMVPDDEIEVHRASQELESSDKSALLEIGNLIGGATDEALRQRIDEGLSVRSIGCQGVRADVRPAFPYEEGSDLMLGRAEAHIGPFPPFDLIMMLPLFG